MMFSAWMSALAKLLECRRASERGFVRGRSLELGNSMDVLRMSSDFQNCKNHDKIAE